jgi:uncharacterized membrane protein
MAQSRSLIDKFFLFIKGLGMGAANKVPGVSGGIVAFVAGFYSEFIYSLTKINFKALILLFNGRFRSLFTYVNGGFMLYIISGMVFSYFSVSLVIDHFLSTAPLLVWSLFFGMILGSIYYIGKDFKQWDRTSMGFALMGLLLGIIISSLDPAQQNDNLLFVFFCGFIGVSGMTLPGLSGSFILILMGNYVLLMVESVNALLNAIIALFSWDLAFFEVPENLNYLKIIAVFTLGSIVGLVSLSHLINYVLKHYQKITTATIIGFISGSLGVVWPWKKLQYMKDELGQFILDTDGNKIVYNYNRFLPDLSTKDNLYAMGFILIGVLVLIALEHYGSKQKK